MWLRRYANSLSASTTKFVVVSFGSNCVTRSKTDERVVENLETVIDTCVSAIQDTIKAVECCKDAHVLTLHLGADAHDKVWKIILNHIWGPLLQRCLQ